MRNENVFKYFTNDIQLPNDYIKKINVINKSEVAHKDINEISSEELQEYFNTLTYYSNSYISKIIEQFSQAFKYAMNKDSLLLNPMYQTIVPKSTRQDKKIRALEINDQQDVLKLE